ncbi:uncharacterized protein BDR25DRAFT_357644 [Lindgomyces ingoldianus]|uniref:Uncharacterized protein n=1 Tax=Lindgomyces ingoldianus TaxID=673940 RepID=A0ACB6QMY5_9PLEO|nr:uncharacterized protein BDR25DRAFT_357644 [Lindgomyces ingoldianus]KAF2468339.1 hypothetical protein BDR25DRAFT_357644 [Lindgomyces ingoldianus]
MSRILRALAGAQSLGRSSGSGDIMFPSSQTHFIRSSEQLLPGYFILHKESISFFTKLELYCLDKVLRSKQVQYTDMVSRETRATAALPLLYCTLLSHDFKSSISFVGGHWRVQVLAGRDEGVRRFYSDASIWTSICFIDSGISEVDGRDEMMAHTSKCYTLNKPRILVGPVVLGLAGFSGIPEALQHVTCENHLLALDTLQSSHGHLENERNELWKTQPSSLYCPFFLPTV